MRRWGLRVLRPSVGQGGGAGLPVHPWLGASLPHLEDVPLEER